MRAPRVLLASLLALSMTGALPVARAGTAAPVVTRTLVDPDGSRAHWTPKRIAAARPAPLLRVAAPAGGGFTAFSTASIPPVPRPLPYEAYQIEDPSAAPYSGHGVIFFTDGFGIPSACSGTAITSENKSVVWTAGHCLYSRAGFSTDVVFIPGFELGETFEHEVPYGVFPATQLAVPTQYLNEPHRTEFDFGAFVTSANESGQLLGDVVVPRGIAFHQSPAQTLQSFGYPGEPAELFDGEHMETCISVGSGRLFGGLVGMGCNMEEGSSGGGWVDEQGRVISNVSGGLISLYDEAAFGPPLGEAARTLYNSVRGGSGPTPDPKPSSRTHPMSLTLDVRTHGIAKGRLVAEDGFPGCAAYAWVTITRLRSDGVYYPIKNTVTGPDGRYRVAISDRSGRYLAHVMESPSDPANNCAETLRLARHSH